MTSKEAYLKIQDFINDIQLGITRSSLDIVEPLNVIRNLTKQSQPTLSECIKEWEDKDCDVIEWNNPKRYEISNVDETIYFEIIQIKGKYLVDNHCCEYAKPEIIHLLSKTLKALEVENES